VSQKPAPNLGRTLLHVAWMAILLGLVVEAGVLLVATSYGKALEAKPILADVVQKVSWSLIVCVGLALGRGATRLFAAQGGLVMGIAGLVSAPLAFAVARSLHEGIQEALFIKVFAGGGGSPVLLALIKGLEYGCLGALLPWLAGKPWGRAAAHAGAGLAVGLVFGALMLKVMLADAAAPPTTGALVSRALNEIINPVGCALTLYAAELLGRGTQPAGEARV
jgi:hypothetical protein